MPALRRFVALALLPAALLAIALPAAAQGTSTGAAPKVRLSTSLGDVVVQLDAEKAPRTVANFLQYVKSGHYNGTVFHRVIEDFMIQGGGFTAALQQKPTKAPIPLESRNGLRNERGTLAMARTMDPQSATAQFFINVKDNPFLDADNARDGHGYAVFGRVVEGMDVVDRIKAVPVGDKAGMKNVPLQPVTLKKATLEK